MTADPEAVSETFAFACGDCGETWERTFTVLFFTDATGLGAQEYVDEDGAAMRTPLADAVCPKCEGRKVHVMAPGPGARARAAEHEDHPHHLHFPHRHKKESA